ncbi:dihydrofolate reductase [Tahibacter amnicola]|uniref:Dihydrofolate reductase n=1 Tax=Tahibacter amnicola TaxID=2976241 RepID=A0ABY6BBK9_9GAMM|nr:dihydrofolate reductase [Tahibacter amnicola]UXI67446.1 dihydrofolate reductase [Tahibacter amnicola]
MLSLIVALDAQRAIGRDGDMPWHLPDDLRRFKQLTLGKPVLMGRKTAVSIGRPLPGRRNLVLSRDGEAPYPTQETVRSLEQARELTSGEELMVIGGGEIYRLAMPLAERMYLTHVQTAVDDADTWFPPFDPADWRVVSRERRDADARHAYAMEFADYARR